MISPGALHNGLLASAAESHAALERVGTDLSIQTAINIARPGGAIGRVGVPPDVTILADAPTFFNSLTISAGPASPRAYFDELLPDVLEGRIVPGLVFDFIGNIEMVPDGCRAWTNVRPSRPWSSSRAGEFTHG